MEKIEIEEIRKIEMDILDYFDDFCHNNHLKYSIAGGTLIGAIRHKGYIPWDDDIDVFMLRDEYERFINLVESNEFKYKVLIPFKEGNYNTFIKIIDPLTIAVQTDYERNIPGLGVWIDVLPLDNIPDNNLDYKRFMRKRKFWHRIRNAGLYKWPKSIFQIPFWIISKIFSPVIAARRMSNVCRMYENVQTSKIGLLVYETNLSFVYERKYLDSYIRLPFENRSYDAYKEYDYVLSQTYGDYMKLPPIEEQIGKHFIEAWRK